MLSYDRKQQVSFTGNKNGHIRRSPSDPFFLGSLINDIPLYFKMHIQVNLFADDTELIESIEYKRIEALNYTFHVSREVLNIILMTGPQLTSCC